MAEGATIVIGIFILLAIAGLFAVIFLVIMPQISPQQGPVAPSSPIDLPSQPAPITLPDIEAPPEVDVEGPSNMTTQEKTIHMEEILKYLGNIRQNMQPFDTLTNVQPHLRSDLFRHNAMIEKNNNRLIGTTGVNAKMYHQNLKAFDDYLRKYNITLSQGRNGNIVARIRR